MFLCHRDRDNNSQRDDNNYHINTIGVVVHDVVVSDAINDTPIDINVCVSFGDAFEHNFN